MAVAAQRQELTNFQKAEIVALSSVKNAAEVGRDLHIPRRTVSNFLQRYHERASIENLPRSGRPRETSIRADRWLNRIALDNTQMPLKELKSIHNIPVSTRTIQRRLQKVGVRKWRAVNRPYLTEQHARKRLKWANEHANWTVEQWAKVIWSDESAIKKDSDGKTVWVYRHKGKAEKYLPKNVRPRKRDGDLVQMVWGCFLGNKLGPLVFIDEGIKKDVYIAILGENLLGYVDALKEDGLQDIIFQHDNAPPHVAKLTREWLKNEREAHGFIVMEWPPNSPDMNPIENLWSILKQELHRRYPDTKYLSGSPAKVRSILKQRLWTIWWDIGEEVLNKLIESMPERVRELREVRGWYTRF